MTRRTYVRHLKAFFRWCRKAGATDTVATDGVALRKTPRTFVRCLTPDKVNHLVRTIREEARSAHRLADLLVSAVHTGLRRGQIVNLMWDAVDLDRRVLTVANTADFQTKSREDRRVPLSGTAVDVRRHRAALADPSVPCVWTHSRGRIRPDYLSEAFRMYAWRVGLEGALYGPGRVVTE